MPGLISTRKSSFAEEEELVLYGIEPICPVVLSRTGDEFMRYLLLQKLFMQVAVHLIEEIF